MQDEIAPYLERLRALPFAERLDVRQGVQRGDRCDAIVRIRTGAGVEAFAVEVRTGPLNTAHLHELLARRRAGRFMLLTPYVPAEIGQQLAEKRVNYMDLAGNCHVAIDRTYVAHVEGRRRPRTERRGRGLGATGYQAIFALLAERELVRAPVRRIAEAAGVGKTVVGELFERLDADGTLGRTVEGRVILRRTHLLDRWLTGYADLLRPRLLVGRYHVEEADPGLLEKRLEKALHGVVWGWGGGAAALRLTRHYRGDETVVHVEQPPADLARQVRALPAADGLLTVLRGPGPLALKGPRPNVAHPLLVYTELLLRADERAREAAAEVRERFLEGL